jgi:AcrR family transcriptional regulator
MPVLTLAPQPLTHRQRRQQNRDAMLAAILDTARAIMREDGAAALNLNELARRMGMKPPSLYEYFPGGKMAVYDALFRQGIRLYAEWMQAGTQSRPDGPERLRAALESAIQFSMAYPELYQICFERPVPGFVPSPESLRESFGFLAASGNEIERTLQAAGLRPDLPLDQVRDVFVAISHGLATLHMANEPEQPIGQGRFGGLAPVIVALLQDGWGARPTARKPRSKSKRRAP